MKIAGTILESDSAATALSREAGIWHIDTTELLSMTDMDITMGISIGMDSILMGCFMPMIDTMDTEIA